MSKQGNPKETSRDEKPRCGLCGKRGKLTRTPCCGNWICDDADKYVPFSYARNSCFTNHAKYTICAVHHQQQHAGRWQDCVACREGQPVEMYVHSATNEYNFEKLENPPQFDPTYCSGCGVVIRLARDGYTLKGDDYCCEACGAHEPRASTRNFLKQFSPPSHAPSGIEKVPVRITGTGGKYPLASLAYYGPDNMLATKLVVSVLKASGGGDGPLHRWITHAGDIRKDESILQEVESFLQEHGVQQRIITDRIIGCPHEEGKDYPMGGECPHCPFWHNRDRFTHELLPSREMTPAQILAELSDAGTRQPREAIHAADAHREALVGPLLHAIERGLADPKGASDNESLFFSFATYLLARWREPRAYPAIICWLSLPDEGAFDIGGDTVTCSGGLLLALVCGGDLQPIKTLILNREADEYCRGQAVRALALLAAWREVPHQEVTQYFTWLGREGLEREPGHVWDALAGSSVDIEALAAFPELRRAFKEGLVDQSYIAPGELDEAESGPRGMQLAEFRENHPAAIDVISTTAAWACFMGDPVAEQERARMHDFLGDLLPEFELPLPQPELPMPKPELPSPLPRPTPLRAPPKVGRNQPCPCGSGKKYKKCCGQ